MSVKPIIWFSEIRERDLSLIGQKALSLGLMYHSKFPISSGFVLTTSAYLSFLEETGLKNKINELLSSLKLEDYEHLKSVSQQLQELILDAKMPFFIRDAITEAYSDLNVDMAVSKVVGRDVLNSLIKSGRDLPFVAIRSSIYSSEENVLTCGQYPSYLNVKNKDDVVLNVQKCWASLFNPRALYYRLKQEISHDSVLVAVIIQRMVDPQTSGVLTTFNPLTCNDSEIMIEAAFGFSDVLIHEGINLETYLLDKPTLTLTSKKSVRQDYGIFRDQYTGKNIKKELTEQEGSKQKLIEEEMNTLAKYAKILESVYKKRLLFEWMIERGRIYFLQFTPLLHEVSSEFALPEHTTKLLQGISSGSFIVSGNLKFAEHFSEFLNNPSAIFVVKTLSSACFDALKNVKGIILEEGGFTSYAAVVCRELHIPCIVGATSALQILHEGDFVTLDCVHGIVYSGTSIVVSEPETLFIPSPLQNKSSSFSEVGSGEDLAVLGTKLFLHLEDPRSFQKMQQPLFEGVFLPLDFIIAHLIGKHPLYFIQLGQQADYVSLLVEHISKIANLLAPNPLIVLFSNLKSDQYQRLIGGIQFESSEENSLLGLRGCSRYTHESFKQAFALEVKAIQQVRERGLRNVHVGLSFVRNVDDVRKCLKVLEEHQLYPGYDFKTYLVGSVPSLAFSPDEFACLPLSGLIIDLDCLTQTILGVDCTNIHLSSLNYLDERNAAVLKALSSLITSFKKQDKKVAVYGNNFIHHHDFFEFLIRTGVDTFAVHFDSLYQTRRLLGSLEKSILLHNFRNS